MGGASIYDDDGIYWLVYVFQALFFSQGFLNAVVYISNKWHVFRAVYWSHRSSRRISDFGSSFPRPALACVPCGSFGSRACVCLVLQRRSWRPIIGAATA